MPLSGKFGVVNGVSVVRNWNINDISSPERYVASNTAIGRFTNPGVEDWNGGFTGFGGTVPDAVLPGKIFTFTGYTAPTSGVWKTVGVTYTGLAIIDSLAITWNWGAAQSLEWEVGFSAAEAGLTEGTGTFTDENNALPEVMCGLKVETGAQGSEIEWENLTTATLTLTSENVEFVNSSTGCFTHRDPGIVETAIAITEQEEKQTRPKGSDQRVLMYTTPTLYWLIEWAHLQDYSGLTVDIETGAINEKTANLVMSGSDGTNLGKIVTPGGTQVWPPASS